MNQTIRDSCKKPEGVALSRAVRDLVPFTDQNVEMAKIFGDKKHKDKLHCTSFEDNNGALELITTKPRYRPCTKHISIKNHHFRERVSNRPIATKPINPTVQKNLRINLPKHYVRAYVGTFEYRYLHHKFLG